MVPEEVHPYAFNERLEACAFVDVRSQPYVLGSLLRSVPR